MSGVNGAPNETSTRAAPSLRLRGRCYRLGDDVPHPGGVIPNWLIAGRHMDPKELVPHLFEETDPGFHTRAKAGDIIVTGTPTGAGARFDPPIWLVPGDVVEVTAEGIGTLSNSVVDE